MKHLALVLVFVLGMASSTLAGEVFLGPSAGVAIETKNDGFRFETSEQVEGQVHVYPFEDTRWIGLFGAYAINQTDVERNGNKTDFFAQMLDVGIVARYPHDIIEPYVAVGSTIGFFDIANSDVDDGTVGIMGRGGVRWKATRLIVPFLEVQRHQWLGGLDFPNSEAGAGGFGFTSVMVGITIRLDW